MILTVGLSGSSALAALIAYDGFNYSSGSVVNNMDGGSGWSGAWSAAQTTVTYPGLSYPGLATGGGAAVPAAQLGVARVDGRFFPTIASDLSGGVTTFWMSMLMRTTAFPMTPDACGIGIGDAVIGFDPAISSLGVSRYGIFPTFRYADPVLSTKQVAYGETVFLVVRVDLEDYVSAGGINGTTTLFVDPSPGDVAPDVAGVSLRRNLYQVGAFSIQYSNSLIYDELRIGNTYLDVAPGQDVPETSAVLGTVGTLAISLFRPRHPKCSKHRNLRVPPGVEEAGPGWPLG